jgi:hypothetical protein
MPRGRRSFTYSMQCIIVIVRATTRPGSTSRPFRRQRGANKSFEYGTRGGGIRPSSRPGLASSPSRAIGLRLAEGLRRHIPCAHRDATNTCVDRIRLILALRGFAELNVAERVSPVVLLRATYIKSLPGDHTDWLSNSANSIGPRSTWSENRWAGVHVAASSPPNAPRRGSSRPSLRAARVYSIAAALRHERTNHDCTPGHENKGFIGRHPLWPIIPSRTERRPHSLDGSRRFQPQNYCY